ncbi:MAG: serine hydrolase [Marinomonas sp.]
MRKTLLAAAAAAFTLSTPAAAQSRQDTLDGKYDRALAAGYKALMLCSAIGIAERNRTKRTPESVEELELRGIQKPLDAIVDELEYEIVRRPSGQIAHVAVDWDAQMPPRIAAFFHESGCSALPIGTSESWTKPDEPIKMDLLHPSVPERGYRSPRFGETVDAAFAQAYGQGTRTTAVLISEDGTTWGERYAPGFSAGTPQRTWSVAKSIAATLVGVAVHEGEADVNEPVGMNYWRQGGSAEPRNAITLDNLLRMASGRYTDTPGNRSLGLYWGGSTVNETATGWPLIHKPGTVFRYANNDSLMAVKAIDNYISYYKPAEFFKKAGMRHTVAETDIRGDYILSSQVWSTARDLAKLGQLYLDDGIVGLRQGDDENAERVLPENWRDYVSSPSGPQPQGRKAGYGAGFWLMNKSEGVPKDTFYAAGRRGQFIVIVPSKNVVIVRRGEDPGAARFDIIGFTRDVLAAL